MQTPSAHEENVERREAVERCFAEDRIADVPEVVHWRSARNAAELLRDGGHLTTPEGREVAVQIPIPTERLGGQYGTAFFEPLNVIFEDDISWGRDQEAVDLARAVAERDDRVEALSHLVRVYERTDSPEVLARVTGLLTKTELKRIAKSR